MCMYAYMYIYSGCYGQCVYIYITMCMYAYMYIYSGCYGQCVYI